MEPPSLYLGCQPLVDRQERLVGYRLFGHALDADTLGTAFGHDAHGERMLFVDIDAGALASRRVADFDRARCVLQLVGAPGEADVLQAQATALRAAGVRLSIANAGPGSPWLPHLGLASWVRVDARGLPDPHLERYVEALKRRGPRVIVAGLASRTDGRRALACGGDLLEGYWFETTDTGSSKAVAPIYGAVMRGLSLVRAEAPFREIEQGIRSDPTLAFRLLRYVNSAAFGLAAEIGSIADAVAMLGYRQVGRWLGLSLVTAKVDAGAHAALAVTAIARGRLMELVAAAAAHDVEPADAFMVGLFSLLDALLDMPIERVVQTLSPPAEVAQALLGRAGGHGRLLRLVESCEQPALAGVEELASSFGLTPGRLGRLQLEALAWAEHQLR